MRLDKFLIYFLSFAKYVLLWKQPQTPIQFSRCNFFQKFMAIRLIYCFFCSNEEWTYLFKVISTFECPRISDKVLMSNPNFTHLEANICLKAWKWTDGNFTFFKMLAKRYCIVLGSTGFSPPETRYSLDFPLNFSRIETTQSGIGIFLLED